MSIVTEHLSHHLSGYFSFTEVSVETAPQLIKPSVPEKELAVVAFNGDNALIVYTNNGLLQREIEATSLYDAIELILDSSKPDHGIWVWEGRIKTHKCFSDSYFYDFEYEVEFITDLWRNPTEKEWKAIMEQRNPFEDEITIS